MKVTKHDFVEKLTMVNLAADKHGLPFQFGYDYNTKGKGLYCLKRLNKDLQWVQATDWMPLLHLWLFLDGMLASFIYMEE